MTINAIRLRTIDPADAQGRFRYLHAPSGDAPIDATRSDPSVLLTSEIFFFEPSVFPLVSDAALSLDLCDSSFGPSGLLVRVDHGVKVFPRSGRKDPPMVTYEIGGPGELVWVTDGFPAGYPAYPGDDPSERIFQIVKAGGGQINNGDQVSLRINSNWGQVFYFQVTGPEDGAHITGDGTAPALPSTSFIIELFEVGPQGVCGTVKGTVTRASGGQAISGAQVVIPGNQSFSATTTANGAYTLGNASGSTCVPAGTIQLQASANRYQTKTNNSVVVPPNGTVNVPFALDCTLVKVRVVDGAGLGMPGQTVMLMDASGNLLLDPSGQPYIGNTGLDGSVTFSCVPHGAAKAQSLADPSQIQPFNVPPSGATVTIVVQSTCGNIVGKVVTDPVTLTGIPNATVIVAGNNLQATADGNGNFRFNCVRPPGQYTLVATSPSCGAGTASVNVPSTGDTPLAVIPLNCNAVTVDSIVIMLQWGSMPSDLDAHLSGPNQAGGRFHLYYGNRLAPPVPFVALSVDDQDAYGPETITISKSGATFVAGDYHVWINNYYNGTFAGSNAVVTVLQMTPQGIPTQLTRQEVQFAAGAPADDIWHVVNLTVTAAGNVTVNVVQALLPGNALTVL